MSKQRKHRGELLKDTIKSLGVKVEVAANRAGYSRSAYYKHIEDENLSLHILIRYGKGLDYDFSEVIPEINSLNQVETEKPTSLKEALKVIEHLKEKYYLLLEKYNALLEHKIQ